jgi:Holliday junction resolvase
MLEGNRMKSERARLKTETEIKKEITDYLKAIGYKVYRMQAGFIKKGFQLNSPGTPDLLAIGPRITVWIEVKAADGKLRESQVKEIAEIEEMGQCVLVARSVQELQEYLP